MAALVAGQIQLVWNQEGQANNAVTVAVTNVTAADTADLAQWFSVIKRAVFLGDSYVGGATCSVTGTVVTIPAGPSADTGYITALGDTALA